MKAEGRRFKSTDMSKVGRTVTDTGYRAVCPKCGGTFGECHTLIGKERDVEIITCPKCAQEIARRVAHRIEHMKTTYAKQRGLELVPLASELVP